MTQFSYWFSHQVMLPHYAPSSGGHAPEALSTAPETLALPLREVSEAANLADMDIPTPQEALRKLLLARLRPLVETPGRAQKPCGMQLRGTQLFTYCCFTTERITAFETVQAVIGIVLNGTKEFWVGNSGQRYSAGQVFVLPAGTKLDVVNIPDERRGRYEALIVEVHHVPAALAALPELPEPAGRDGRHDVTLTAELVDALAHAAHTLATSDHAEILAEHRLAEVLMLLRNDPAARCLFDVSLRERIARMVVAEPTRSWTANTIAARLGMGASTLRRHLAQDGTALREVLATARMQIARGMLERGEANVSSAAEAAGYASRSHFVRRYRSVYGAVPSEHLAR
jgi:AraC-like DNA-binding protein